MSGTGGLIGTGSQASETGVGNEVSTLDNAMANLSVNSHGRRETIGINSAQTKKQSNINYNEIPEDIAKFDIIVNLNKKNKTMDSRKKNRHNSSKNRPQQEKDGLDVDLENSKEQEEGDEIELNNDVDDEEEEDEDAAKKFVMFENWLLANDAQFPHLYLKKYTGDVRGVHAKKTLDPYVCVLSVPLKLLITDEMGRKTKLGQKVFSRPDISLSSPNLIAVIIYILTTREDPNHFFQPYYKILPSDYSNFPIFWSQEKLNWLTGSPLIHDIVERKRNMRCDYNELLRVCPELGRFSFNEFLEIRTAVGSRNFGIVVNGNKMTAMVPMADMLNHYRPRQTSWTFDNMKNAFTITSLSELGAGMQILDSYGKKCNSKFLLHYGFAVETNRESDGKCQNELGIRFSLRPESQDPLRNTRIAIVGPARVSRSFRLSMNIEDKSTQDLLSYLRIVVATENELDMIIAKNVNKVTSSQSSSSNQLRFVSCRNELEVLKLLSSQCTKQLTKYTQSRDENLVLLKSGKVPPFTDERTALIVVMGEQEICNFWAEADSSIGQLLLIGDTAQAGKGINEKADIDLYKALKSLPQDSLKNRDLYRYAYSIATEVKDLF